VRKKTEALILSLGYALKQATYGKATVANGYCPKESVAVSFEVFIGEAEKLGLGEEAHLLARVVLEN